MAEFEPLVVVGRRLQIELGKNTLTEACMKRSFERFCATGTVGDREHQGRPSKITERRIGEVRDIIQDGPQSRVRAVATTCSIPPTTACRVMTEYL